MLSFRVLYLNPSTQFVVRSPYIFYTDRVNRQSEGGRVVSTPFYGLYRYVRPQGYGFTAVLGMNS